MVNSRTYWGPEIAFNPPSVHYNEIMADDKGVGKWTAKIVRMTLFRYMRVQSLILSARVWLLLRGWMPSLSRENSGAPRADLIYSCDSLWYRQFYPDLYLNLTLQGGFYDFTSDLTMKDTAYTSLALPAHTDTTYFTDPAGLQMFHLLSHTDGEGGASLLVDGFKAAHILYQESMHSYQTLTTTPIPWHASGNEGITITPATKFPVFNLHDLQDKQVPELMQVRWNNDDRGVVAIQDDSSVGAGIWYEAARKWNEILKRKDMEYWAQLKPGHPLSMDTKFISCQPG